MSFFTTDFIDFFLELEQNNNKEWFHSQKTRYQSNVKKTFENFVNALIHEIGKQEPLTVLPKDCILRINRDIRFAKDKTPYNLHVTAFISQGGRKDKSIPGFFIRLSPKMIGIMGGCFAIDKTQLASIRQSLIKDPEPLKSAIANPDFKSKFGGLKGDTMKRIPKEYQEVVKTEPLILNKQYYFMAELSPDLITSDQLLDICMDYFKAMKPVNDTLKKMMASDMNRPI